MCNMIYSKEGVKLLSVKHVQPRNKQNADTSIIHISLYYLWRIGKA
jgi:hypothetical protein